MIDDIIALASHLRCSAVRSGRRIVWTGARAAGELRAGGQVDHVWGGWGDPADPRDIAAHAVAAWIERSVKADWPGLRRACDALYQHNRAQSVMGLLRGHRLAIVRGQIVDADPGCDHQPMVVRHTFELPDRDGSPVTYRIRSRWPLTTATVIDALSETRDLAPHQRQAIDRARCAALGRPVPEWVYPPHQQLNEWRTRVHAHFWGGEDLPGMPNGFTPAGDIRPTLDGERITIPVAIHRATGIVVVDLDRAPRLTHRAWRALGEPLQVPGALLSTLHQRAGVRYA